MSDAENEPNALQLSAMSCMQPGMALDKLGMEDPRNAKLFIVSLFSSRVHPPAPSSFIQICGKFSTN